MSSGMLVIEEKEPGSYLTKQLLIESGNVCLVEYLCFQNASFCSFAYPIGRSVCILQIALRILYYTESKMIFPCFSSPVPYVIIRFRQNLI